MNVKEGTEILHRHATHAGWPMGYRKCQRVVRAFLKDRAGAPDSWAHLITYADPTGETATNNLINKSR